LEGQDHLRHHVNAALKAGGKYLFRDFTRSHGVYRYFKENEYRSLRALLAPEMEALEESVRLCGEQIERFRSAGLISERQKREEEKKRLEEELKRIDDIVGKKSRGKFLLYCPFENFINIYRYYKNENDKERSAIFVKPFFVPKGECSYIKLDTLLAEGGSDNGELKLNAVVCTHTGDGEAPCVTVNGSPLEGGRFDNMLPHPDVDEIAVDEALRICVDTSEHRHDVYGYVLASPSRRATAERFTRRGGSDE
jgi:hypothetical protein